MTSLPRIAPRAWDDIEAASRWYDMQRDGLGFEFSETVDRAIAKREPGHWLR